MRFQIVTLLLVLAFAAPVLHAAPILHVAPVIPVDALRGTIRQASDVVIIASPSPVPSASPPNSPPATPSPVARESQDPVLQPPPTTAATTPPPAASATPIATATVAPTASPAVGGVKTPATQSKRGRGGVIAGSVIAAILLVLIVVALLWFIVFRRKRDEAPIAAAAASEPSSGIGGEGGPGTGARGLPAAAAAAAAAASGGAGGGTGAAMKTENSDGTIQDIELAEAEATMPATAAYVVTDTARHHGPMAGAGGSGAAAALASLDSQAVGAGVPRGPSPPPHDYVVGAGPIASRTDFEDIRDRFARDEIGDRSAVLGEHMATIAAAPTEPSVDPAAEAATREAPAPSAVEGGLSEVSPGGGEDVPRAAVVAPPVEEITPAVGESGSAPMVTQTDIEESTGATGAGSAVVGAIGVSNVPTPMDEEGASFGQSGSLPDRSGDPSQLSFDPQEKLAFGQDRSGSVSEASQSLTGREIKAEMAETASFDKDPMDVSGNKEDPTL